MSVKSTFKPIIQHVTRFKWSFGSVLLVAILALIIFIKVSGAIGSIKYALTPPILPEYQNLEVDNVNPMGWPNTDAEWFHHASQGTATIPVPYQWLVALEAPRSSPWSVFFGSTGPYIGEYILRLGFIKQDATRTNPDALPIGIAKTASIFFPGIDRKAEAAGFTCAACHTGQITHGDTRYVIDGGPAMMDLGLLTRSLGAALGQTALSSKFSILDGRFDRFARNVLGSTDNILTRARLRNELDATLKQLATEGDVVDVTEGFSRLDALNRIGNQVFKVDMKRPRNYAPITAPVNFPHLWTTSWFDWVQYDASIMQPLIRNTGEALGVKAYVDTTGPDEQRFASSVDVPSLVKIEKWLGGTHPLAKNEFNGLRAPKWPGGFPAVDPALAKQGGELYMDMCKGCHLPPIKSAEFWTEKYWKPISYLKDGVEQKTGESYLTLKVIGLDKIGTDPAQAGVLADRTIDTSDLNLATEVCTVAPVTDETGWTQNALTYVPLDDSATSNFGLALGAFVERTNQQFFGQNYIPESQQVILEGSRPNCLQVAQGYKARPLNGVWATAPFLHNGSVANLYQLLSAPEDRPTFIELGNQEFDTNRVGIVQGADIQSINDNSKRMSYKVTEDYQNGRFILDTRQPGNHKTGHAFVDKNPDGSKPRGRIGRKLAEAEKMALIEYLKTI